MNEHKIAGLDLKNSLQRVGKPVKQFMGHLSGSTYKGLQGKATQVDEQMGKILNKAKLNPKDGKRLRVLRGEATTLNNSITGARKSMNKARGITGGTLALGGGGIALANSQKKTAAAKPIPIENVEDRLNRYFTDAEEPEIRKNLADQAGDDWNIQHPVLSTLLGLGIGAAGGAAVGAIAKNPVAGAVGGGTLGGIIGAALPGAAREQVSDNVARQYLRKNPEYQPEYNAWQEREKDRTREDYNRSANRAAALGAVGIVADRFGNNKKEAGMSIIACLVEAASKPAK